jgi:sigma-B regulation protein RsbU (phosphoserine phosphatase)
VLFQEQEPAAVTARLLSLASSMAQATASALYVLEEAGNRASSLRLEQVFGMPESLLAQLRGVDGCAWPDVLLDAPVHLATRRGDPAAEGPAVPMGMLAPDCVPPLLQSLVVVPLRYHGVHSGVCLLFNPALDAARTGELLGRLQSFGQLGAALLHRLSLEALAANSRTFARELEIAEVIQGRLQPQGPPRTDEYDFAWSTIAAKSIGGDYLDVLMSDLGDVYVAVADASGHGVNSALLMSSFRANYRASAPWLEPEDLAAALNKEVVHEVGATGMFVTGALVRLERDTRRLAACSAGHNPMLLYRAATGRIDELASNGPPLGFVARPIFDATHDQLARGDVLVLYTDGLTEATDGALEMFGEERLCAVLRQHAADGAAAVLAAIRQALVAFTGRDRHDDDVSVVVVKAR